MKTCTKCQEDKPLKDFHRKGSGYQTRCKPCNIEGRKAHYQANRDHEIARNKEWIKREREWLYSLKDNPCTDCLNIFHFSAMHWDHLPQYSKRGDVSTLIKHGRKAVLEEIKKCELVCANCHAVRTWTRNNTAV